MAWTGTGHNGEGNGTMARKKTSQPTPPKRPVWEWFMDDPTTEEAAEIARDYYGEVADSHYREAAALWNTAARLNNAGKYNESETLSYQAQEIHEQGQHAEHVDQARMIALLQALKGR